MSRPSDAPSGSADDRVVRRELRDPVTSCRAGLAAASDSSPYDRLRPVGRREPSHGGVQRALGDVEASPRSQHPCPRGKRRDAHWVVESPQGGRACRELVEHQLGRASAMATCTDRSPTSRDLSDEPWPRRSSSPGIHPGKRAGDAPADRSVIEAIVARCTGSARSRCRDRSGARWPRRRAPGG